MKYAVAISSILVMVVAGVVVYELTTGNSSIQAKPEKQSNNNIGNHYQAKLVVIQAYDRAQQTFIVTRDEFTGIASSIVSSSDTNSPVNATLDTIANFFVAHSGPPPMPSSSELTNH